MSGPYGVGRALVRLAGFLAIMGSASVAVAEPTTEDRALATTLFREAKSLLEDNRVPEACRKLEESERLDPQPGTLLNLAVCHEREGKSATAWVELRQSRVFAERDGRDDRLALIDEHLRALEPKLSKIVIVVPAGADRTDFEVTLDERLVRRPAWGSQIPVDPGAHRIVAKAGGKKPSQRDVTVRGDAEVQTVTLAPLEDEPSATPPPGRQPIVPPEVPRTEHTRPDRTAAYVAGGIGLAGIVIGSVAGMRAIVKHRDAPACTSQPCPDSVDANDSAKTAADVSTVAFSIGVVSLAVGAYFWFSGKSGQAASTVLRVAPTGALQF